MYPCLQSKGMLVSSLRDAFSFRLWNTSRFTLTHTLKKTKQKSCSYQRYSSFKSSIGISVRKGHLSFVSLKTKVLKKEIYGSPFKKQKKATYLSVYQLILFLSNPYSVNGSVAHLAEVMELHQTDLCAALGNKTLNSIMLFLNRCKNDQPRISKVLWVYDIRTTQLGASSWAR